MRLGVFCFDLHSDRGRKSEFYTQLREAVNNPRELIAAGVSADDLSEQRDRLNRAVRRLHERRQLWDCRYTRCKAASRASATFPGSKRSRRRQSGPGAGVDSPG